MNDLEYQVSYVVIAVDRILSQIDLDPLSPTYGCAHLAYWRDKTSDVADMRRQEAMLTLSLVYARSYPCSPWEKDKRIIHAVNALVAFWAAQQNADGSFDEWYKGERGFAATAFTAHAAARTLALVGEYLDLAVRGRAQTALRKAANWLAKHDDLFKANHQAVAVCALAWCAKVLADDAYRTAALKKYESIAAVQRAEGWFPEVGNVDIGYTFLTAEYLAMAMALGGEWPHRECAVRAFDFACNWLDAHLILGEEYGICRNPYVSRIAIVLLAPHSRYAASLLGALEKHSVGFEGVRPILADELRLNRWAYLPLLAYDYYTELAAQATVWANEKEIPCADRTARTQCFHDAGLIRISQRDYSAVFAPATGGLLRLFGRAHGDCITDVGYVLGRSGAQATNYVYNRKNTFTETADGFETTCMIVRAKKILPSYWMRVLLRCACSTAVGARFSRSLIDAYRLRKGTALNQSGSNVGARRSAGRLYRKITLRDDSVIIDDVLTCECGVHSEDIFACSGRNEPYPVVRDLSCLVRIPAGKCFRLSLRKIYRIVNGAWVYTADLQSAE